MTTNPAPTAESIQLLRSAVSGPVLVRGDDALAEEVAAFDTTLAHDPDVVVGATGDDDVVAAVRFAADNGLQVHVHATGHGARRPITSGLIISTKRLDTVSIDSGTRLATIGAGVRWRAVIDASADLQLAPVTGSSVVVGAVGYALGGGLGPLVRSHGYTSDWVRGFRLVIASGEVITADADNNAGLFWALRGGKGGFGIVTEITLELAPMPALYAGSLFFDGAENIEAALRTWVNWLPDASEKVSTSVALLQMPDLEFIPAPIRGRNLLSLRFAFPGDSAEGERLIAPLRAAAPVYIDGVGELALRDIGMIHNDPEAGGPDRSFGVGLSGIDDALARELLELLGPSSDSPFVVAELRHLGGAAARDTHGPSAVGGRESALMLSMIAVDPNVFDSVPGKTDAVMTAAAAWLSATTNINFGGDTANQAVLDRAWSPEVALRLAALRVESDPGHLFAFGPSER